MRRVLRQDPDVILIGEMREEETVTWAVPEEGSASMLLRSMAPLHFS
jgi:Tfp pilus assembly pilus retraction ATPase PilT